MALNGIDVASYQAEMNVGTANGDFVIVKATQGTNYVNASCNKHVEQTLAAGKKLGLYHFANQGGNATAEADFFVDNIKNYIGKALLVLDFEADAVANGVNWAKTWLDRVYARTGVRPLIYLSLSVENQYNWSPVAKANYGLWAAQYNNYNVVNGYQPRDIYGSVKHWPEMVMFQYTSSGRLSGWGGNLDFDVFYGDAKAWDAYAKTSQSTVAPAPTAKASKPAPAAKKATGTTNDDGYIITNENGVFFPNQTLRVFSYPGIQPTGAVYNNGESVTYFGYIKNVQTGYLYVAYRAMNGHIHYIACRELASGKALGIFK